MKQGRRVLLAALGVAVGAPAAASATLTAHPASVCRDHVAEAAARSGLGVEVIVRMMRAESGGDARAVSSKGAIGCMQIMPATWADLTARYALGPDPFDTRLNVIGGALYLAELTRQFGPIGAFAAYNAGPARYARYLAAGVPLPSETIAYVARLRGDALPDASLPAGGALAGLVAVPCACWCRHVSDEPGASAAVARATCGGRRPVTPRVRVERSCARDAVPAVARCGTYPATLTFATSVVCALRDDAGRHPVTRARRRSAVLAALPRAPLRRRARPRRQRRVRPYA